MADAMHVVQSMLVPTTHSCNSTGLSSACEECGESRRDVLLGHADEPPLKLKP